MRTASLLLLCGSLAGLGCSSSATTTSNSQNDKDRIQGTWIVTSAAAEGLPTDPNPLLNAKFVFEGDTVTLLTDKKKGRFELRPDKDPKEIDLVPQSNESEDNSPVAGIYKFDGETLVLCMASNSSTASTDSTGKVIKSDVKIGKRPTNFADKGDALLLTLTREKK